MTTGYIERVDDLKFKETEDGSTGARVLVGPYNTTMHPTATWAIPALGASFVGLGTIASACKLRTRLRSAFEKDGLYYRYELEYSTKQIKEPANPSSGDSGQRRQSFGGEVQTIEQPNGWVWSTGSGTISIPIPVRVVTANFSRPTKNLDSTQNAAFKALLEANAGKINLVAWDGWANGNVMLTGAEGGTSKDTNGDTIWRYDVQFAVRIVPGKSSDGWQYIMREDGVWDKPRKSGTVDYLYEDYNFTGLDGYWA